MVQSSKNSLDAFEKLFPTLKKQAEKEKHLTENRQQLPATPALPLTPKLPSSFKHIKECLTLLEVDFTELKELTLAKQPDTDTVKQLRDKLRQVKNETRASMRELRTLPRPQGDRTVVSDPTERALELLESPLGDPGYIIIHTGLAVQRDRVAWSVRRVAAQQFSRAKVVISTLLPQKDVPLHTIQRIKNEISRRYALLPKVHLAQHPTLSMQHLHVNKYIY